MGGLSLRHGASQDDGVPVAPPPSKSALLQSAKRKLLHAVAGVRSGVPVIPSPKRVQLFLRRLVWLRAQRRYNVCAPCAVWCRVCGPEPVHPSTAVT